jgi:TonB family protein
MRETTVTPNAMKKTFNILTILLLTIMSVDIFACSCIGDINVKDEIKKSDAVFVGTIFDKEEIKIYYTLSSNMSIYRIEIKYAMSIETIYKGKHISDTTFIFTGSGGGDCGFNFKTGSKYIVYAQNHKVEGRSNGQLYIDQRSAFYTTICKRTKLFDTSEIKEIEKYLKKHNKKSNYESVILVNPESPPIYKNGGEQGLRQFIIYNLKYPTGQSVEGRVYVGFTVDTLGNVKDIEIKRGLTKETDKEAIRIVKMLTFIPGTVYGKSTEMKMVLPIIFSIKKTKDE